MERTQRSAWAFKFGLRDRRTLYTAGLKGFPKLATELLVAIMQQVAAIPRRAASLRGVSGVHPRFAALSDVPSRSPFGAKKAGVSHARSPCPRNAP